ncbi:MAG: ADP-ribosylglycohydrolase family protein [Melioribacteraceae bacterium]|nr:ADP-ribosylglycohydrolase family protein [Melioribacteraceae bacterium]
MKTSILLFLVLLVGIINAFGQLKTDQELHSKLLSVEEYKSAVYASWLGQIVGNTYGLNYEFRFIDDPGPNEFPYGYDWTLDLLRKYNGAFSDDDTDIEYMYLTQMEKHGIDPTYAQLAEAWKYHVREKVWCANRAAVTLMHAGHFPPVTGSKDFNTQWMQIDAQLVNEIWAVTAPGMLDYAVDKSEFAARITNDSFGLEPTLHYAAMYSSAFFEKDIHKLIDIGISVLPPNSRFAKIVEHVKSLYLEYPNDWQTVRRIVKEHYYVSEDYNKHAWPPIDANLNGAFGIMALLYGEGDFQKTLDYSCAFGMDADNQAATMCGLLGIVNGFKTIPEDLLFPLENAEWEKPFNDFYKMVTREGLEDAKISDLAERISQQGEDIILTNGGKIIEKDGEKYYRINLAAEFVAPFELNPLPDFYVEVNKPFSYPIYTGGKSGEFEVILSGNTPSGFEIINGNLSGTPNKSGKFNFRIIATSAEEEKVIDVNILVHSKNIAAEADEILFNKNASDKNIEILRDGSKEQTYYSIKRNAERELDFYGYKWNEARKISAISFNNGIPQEFCGWFTSFEVEYLANGTWTKIEDVKISPEMNLENSQWLKPSLIDYEISFAEVYTEGIRIIGLSGGIEKDAANAHLGMQYYTAISELRVFEK